MSMTLVLTRSEVARLLPLAECIPAIESAFRAEAEGTAPAPGILGIHVAGGGFHVKATSYGPTFAAKINANFPANPDRFALPTIQGVVALFDTERGVLLALMDSIEITALRTAAASAVAAKYLARPEARAAAIAGCGVQGRYQLEAINLVRPLRRAYAVDADRQAGESFAREMGDRLGIPVMPAELASALDASDLVVTCTPSRRALVLPGMVRPGTFIAAVGADNPEKQEIAPTLLAASTVIVDQLQQCLTIGDLHHAVEAGVMTESQVQGTLGQVIAGGCPGRRSENEIIIYDSTGTALQDAAVASLAYERALRQGIGVQVALGT